MIHNDLKRLAIPGIVICLAFIVFLAFYTDARRTAGPGERPFRAGIVGAVKTIDPAKVSSGGERLIASAMYEPLLRFDEETAGLKPCLCQNWGYSLDGKSVVFMLRRDVVFQNGKRLTAADVKASWERAFRFGAGGWKATNLFHSIAGIDDFAAGKSNEIAGIKVLNDYTLRIVLGEPDSAFVYKITNPVFWVVECRDEVDIPPGTGPFVIRAIDKDKSMTFSRFDRYHGRKPQIGEIVFRFFPDEQTGLADFKQGTLDYLDQVQAREMENLADNPRYQHQLVRQPVLAFYALGIGIKQYPMGEADLRRAMNYAVDRNLLVENVLGGVGRPAKGVLPVNVKGYNKSLQGYTFNPEQAGELYEMTDYANLIKPPVLKIAFNSDAGHERLAAGIKTQLEMLGINSMLIPLQWDAYVKKISENQLSLFRITWEADYPDPDAFLYPLFHSRNIGLTNFTGYRNPRVDHLLDAARKEINHNDKRIKLLRQAEQVIVYDAPMVWLFQKEAVKLVGPEVAGFQMDGMQMIDWQKLRIRTDAAKPDRVKGKNARD